MAAPYHPRVADADLADRLAAVGAVVIEGVKGCGKTETARQLCASEVLFDVDQQARRAADLDPFLVLDGPTPRLVDEWQRQPNIWDAIRREVDSRAARGQFILTGSATPRDDVVRHSGAGRIGVQRMRTMTLAEQGVHQPTTSVAELLRTGAAGGGRCTLPLAGYAERAVIGGWPQNLGATEKAARQFVEGYLTTIIEHDIDQVSGARRDPLRVRRFLHAYAQLTAHPATLATILKRARGEADDEVAPSRFSAGPYLDALRRMMIIDELPAWDPKVRSRARLTATEKRLLADPSLAASLLSCSSTRLLRDIETFGFQFEALVAHDLRVYAEAAGFTLYHYREQDGRLEVDLVAESVDGAWVAFEVKLGGNQEDEAATSLLRLKDRVERPPTALAIITATEYGYRREDGVWVLPLGLLGP